MIDRAAAFLDTPVSLVALVTTPRRRRRSSSAAIAREAWREAARLSSRRHIVWVDSPFDRVVSVMPSMYADMWTAAKGMYKMEPAMADGGEVIIYAPHVNEVSRVHGALLDEIGYHCRDYFVEQWARFAHYPGGILAHSTHLKGVRHVRRGERRRNTACRGHAGDRHPARAMRAGEPGIRRSPHHRPRRLADRPRTRYAARCRVPAKVAVPRRPTARLGRQRLFHVIEIAPGLLHRSARAHEFALDEGIDRPLVVADHRAGIP